MGKNHVGFSQEELNILIDALECRAWRLEGGDFGPGNLVYDENTELLLKCASLVETKTDLFGGLIPEAVWNCEALLSNEKVLLLYLCSKAAELTGQFMAERSCSIKDIAKATKMSRRTVIRVIRRLEEHGYMTRRKSNDGESGANLANVFAVTSKIFDGWRSSHARQCR